jgi:hypothetical protein
MKQYKVIALSVGGRANKIFSAGDSVNEDNFIPGRADKLEKLGFLKSTGSNDVAPASISSDEIETEVTKVEKPEQEVTEEVEQTEGGTLLDSIKDSLGAQVETKEQTVTFDQISKKQIIKTLTELGIPFEPTANKTKLYELWLSRDNY